MKFLVVTVKEIMSKPAHTIDVNKTAKEAATLMGKTRRGFLVVTKNGKPIGVVSDSDLIKKVVAKGLVSHKVKIRNVMNSPLVTIQAEEDITAAVRRMKNNNVHRLPVMESGKLTGVISLTDIARTSPEMLNLLEYRLKMKETPLEIKEKITSGICDSCGNFSERLSHKEGNWVCEDCTEEAEE